MTSIRHIAASSAVAPGSADGYLDAAREAILAVGWSRTTLTDIARRAGVSRMTLYRRWPDMRSLLADLMTREWARVLGDVLDRSASDPDGVDRARLVTDVCRAVRALREDELMVRILELDPELLLPYLLHRRGRSQAMLGDVLADRIRRGQRAGTVRGGDPQLLARTLLLTGHGFTLSAHTMGEPAKFDAELARLVDAYLAPAPGRGRP